MKKKTETVGDVHITTEPVKNFLSVQRVDRNKFIITELKLQGDQILEVKEHEPAEGVITINKYRQLISKEIIRVIRENQ